MVYEEDVTSAFTNFVSEIGQKTIDVVPALKTDYEF